MLKLNRCKLAVSISFFLVTAPLSTVHAVSDEVALQLLERLGEMELEISNLRGENEILRKELSDIRISQRERFLEVDKRVSGLEKMQATDVSKTTGSTESISSNTLTNPVTENASIQAIEAPVTITVPQTTPAAAISTTVVQSTPQLATEATAAQRQAIAPAQGTIVAQEVTTNNSDSYYYYGTQDKNSAAGTEATSSSSQQTQKTRAIPDTHKAKAAYNEAYKLLVNDPKSAVPAFRAFMVNYPKHELVANAQYWLGEALYAQKDYSGATEEFMKVLKDHKGSPKAPGAALKLGYSFYELRQWDFARRTLEDTVRFFPDTNAATLATNRLERMTAEGK